MAAKTKRRNPSQARKRPKPYSLQKANGVVAARVRQAGPERFGVVCVDPAKDRSRWMMADFFGNVLLEPANVEHERGQLDAMLAQVRQAIRQHNIADAIVVVERTSTFHLPIKRAFAAAGFDTRIVHPFATKQYRQPANPHDKTDDTDLAAQHRAAVAGFGLIEQPLDDNYRQLRLWVRHRRDLVEKNSSLCCQVRDHLHLTMPGYAACFSDLWDSHLALPLARLCPTPQALLAQQPEQLARRLREQNLRFQERTLMKVFVWARQAPPADPDALWHYRLWTELDDDRTAKNRQIQAIERDIASCLARTPYVLLLAIPGIHVVSAADFAGEMGPISHYANANAITGRCGLFPWRYQSDQTDISGGLVRHGNRRLRAAVLRVADNLAKSNDYFAARADGWRQQRVNECLIRIRIGKNFSRLAFAIVAGKQLLNHPCCNKRQYILCKLSRFHQERQAPTQQLMADLQLVVDHLPRNTYVAESTELAQELQKLQRRRGPQPLAELIPAIFARLGVRWPLSSTGDQASNESSG